MKIYPAFYALLFATLAAQLLFWKSRVPLLPYWREFFFIQNYRFAVWTHTWSLAVEEHFYILLALLLALLARLSSNRADPFRLIPHIFVFVGSACLLLRVLTVSLTHAPNFQTWMVMNTTHSRIDALFFGVFLGYLHHFRPEVLPGLFRPLRNRVAIGAIAAVLLSSCLIFSRDDHFLLMFGLSALYLGFGGLLILSLQVRNALSGAGARAAERVGTLCAFVGTYSYSIYLWHVPFIIAVSLFLRRVAHVQIPGVWLLVIYLVGSCAIGILMAEAIEFPVLRVRDRFFPALQPASPSPESSSASRREVSPVST